MEPIQNAGEEKVHTWPHLLYRELLAALLVTVILWVWSLAVDAPLEMKANPTLSPNPAKAPWYFLGLQELLVYFDPWIAGVMIPGLIIIGLMLIPYVDPNPRAAGRYAFRERPFSVTFFVLGLVMWFGLILVGTAFRGPSWNWYWPWESWEIVKTVPSLENVPAFLGWTLCVLYFGLGWLIARRMKLFRSLDRLRLAVTVFLLLCFAGIFIKIVLRLWFNVKYLLVTPWFNL